MKHFTDTTVLPLSRFIDCYVDGNFQALAVKDGDTVSNDQITETWPKIMTEYKDLLGENELIFYKFLDERSERIKATYDRAVEYIEQIKGTILSAHSLGLSKDSLNTITKYQREWLKTLFSLPYKMDFNDVLRLSLEIKSIEAAMYRYKKSKKHFVLLLEQLELKFDPKWQSKNVKPTREFFDNMLLALSEMHNRSLDTSISVYEYCDALRIANIHWVSIENYYKKLKF